MPEIMSVRFHEPGHPHDMGTGSVRGLVAAVDVHHLSSGGGAELVQPRTDEITFAGQAGTAPRAEFDDCAVTISPGTTTVRAELPDQAALHGLMQRISGLGLELLDVRVVAPQPPD